MSFWMPLGVHPGSEHRGKLCDSSQSPPTSTPFPLGRAGHAGVVSRSMPTTPVAWRSDNGVALCRPWCPHSLVDDGPTSVNGAGGVLKEHPVKRTNRRLCRFPSCRWPQLAYNISISSWIPRLECGGWTKGTCFASPCFPICWMRTMHVQHVQVLFRAHVCTSGILGAGCALVFHVGDGPPWF